MLQGSLERLSLLLLLLAEGCNGINSSPSANNLETAVADGVLTSSSVDFRKELPTVFILGAQKCGTSSLFGLFQDYLDGSMCTHWPKEKHYFDYGYEKVDDLERDVQNCVAGLGKYREQFQQCTDGKTRFDATPNYMMRSNVNNVLYQTYEKVGIDPAKLRFIVILRNPERRFHSAYNHFAVYQHWFKGSKADMKTRGKELYEKQKNEIGDWNKTFEFTNEILFGGLYEPQLQRWFHTFKPSQFLLVTLNQLKRDPNGVMTAISQHVDVKMTERTEEAKKKGFVPSNSSWSEDLSQKSNGPLGTVKLVQKNAHKYKDGVPDVDPDIMDFYKTPNENLMKMLEEYPASFYNPVDNQFDIRNPHDEP
eukprot:CAMPEP_0184487374 /NCGR_PEP_ID=MMETSP0113_2-20130426/9937_1 /TAXON_ID=91329 /ORGANISM="Norrisiella sphaerica, Strain BC52" /LENGTH=364 /DNA_ID=CAMNT_0026869661 /DNA_START=1 /DNA_END=1095 /DNA_ORIENTATION=+